MERAAVLRFHEQLDIDALPMGDLKSIPVDERAFMSPCLEYRLRFSVAHEIGHPVHFISSVATPARRRSV
jgi:hypothetical protein